MMNVEAIYCGAFRCKSSRRDKVELITSHLSSYIGMNGKLRGGSRGPPGLKDRGGPRVESLGG